tara:strand:- start:110 stop:547 length:438 start_codon:yes stop_codon:yes gene_type:complete
MQKHNNIKAFFFLGLFSLMLLHQVFPHLHHQHEETYSYLDIAHSDEDNHHDDNSQEKEDSSYGFFGFVMDMHTHSTVSSDIVLLERNTVEKKTIVDKDDLKSVVETKGFFSVEYRQNSKPPIYHPPKNYFNSYLSSLDSRGPPTC